MRLVGVVADSHDNLPAIERAVEVLKEVGVEALLHAGDIIAPFSLKRFADLGAKGYFVYGNNDGEKLLLAKVASQLGFTLTEQPLMLTLNGYKVIILHGAAGKEETLKLVEALAASGHFDLVVYGHLHETAVRRVGDTLVVNPGEVCGYLTGKRTVAIVDLEERKAEIREI